MTPDPPAGPPIRSVITPGRRAIRRAFRWTTALVGDPEAVRRTILGWVAAKHPGGELPDALMNGLDGEVDDPSSQILAVRRDDHWALRLRQPDAGVGIHRRVPDRWWTTDLAIGPDAAGAFRIQCRVRCSSHPDDNPEPPYLRPGFIAGLVGRGDVADGLPLAAVPHPADDLGPEGCLELLVAVDRTLPVVAVAEPDARRRAELGFESATGWAEAVAERLVGLAHVVHIPLDASTAWLPDGAGRWPLKPGDVRVFGPGFAPDDEPERHPLTPGGRIPGWSHQTEHGALAFARHLRERIIATAAVSGSATVWPLSFAEDLRTVPGPGSTAVADAALLRQLQEEIGDYRGLLQQADLELQETEALWMDWRHRYQIAAARIEELERTLATVRDAAGESDPRPTSYDEIPDWCARRFAGRLVLHSRARQGLKGARYHDLDLVLDALELIAGPYVDYATGVPGAKEPFEAACRERQLEFGDSISENQAGRFGDQYFVTCPHTRRRTLLTHHLKRGNSHDPRHSLRVYFYCDSETGEAVVGWLPSHLKNRMS